VNGLAARISPEIVAGLLSVIVIAALVAVRAPIGTAAGPDASASPSVAVRPTASDALPALVRSALETVVVVNTRLAASGQDLEQELARTDPRAPQIAVILPRITAQVTGVESRSPSSSPIRPRPSSDRRWPPSTHPWRRGSGPPSGRASRTFPPTSRPARLLPR
jgi:hypothetical protein